MEEEDEVVEDQGPEMNQPSGSLPGITIDLVRKYFHYPVREAAQILTAELGYTVSCRNLQRRLRVFGIKQWPYQQVKRGRTRAPRASAPAVSPSVNTVADVCATQLHTFSVTRSDSPMGSAGLEHTQAEFHGGYYEHTFADDDVMDNDETADYGDQEYASLVVSAYGVCKPQSLRVSLDVKGDVSAFPWPELEVGGDRLNWRRLYVTGVARVPLCHGDVPAGAGDEDMLIYFCSCNEHGRQAWLMIDVMLLEPGLATSDRWGEDSAQCRHAQCLEQCARVWYPELGVRRVFEGLTAHRTGSCECLCNVVYHMYSAVFHQYSLSHIHALSVL